MKLFLAYVLASPSFFVKVPNSPLSGWNLTRDILMYLMGTAGGSIWRQKCPGTSGSSGCHTHHSCQILYLPISQFLPYVHKEHRISEEEAATLFINEKNNLEADI